MGKEENKSPISHKNLDDSYVISEKSLDKTTSSEMNYKTELCRTWVEKNYCPYKEKCRFAHGKKDIHEKFINGKHYKQKECNSFYKKGFCPYGPRCHFKHEERKLENITRPYYQCILGSPRSLEKILQRNLNYSRNKYEENDFLTSGNTSGSSGHDYSGGSCGISSQRCHYNKIYEDQNCGHREINNKRTLPVFEKINQMAPSPKRFSYNPKQTKKFVLHKNILNSFM